MGIKIFIVSFMITSFFFFILLIPTRLTIPKSSFSVPMNNSFNITKINRTYPVTFAYLISASKGDSGKLKRLMKALYHPGNYYLIHMDYGAPKAEYRDVVEYVAKEPVFGQVGNVWVVGKRNLVTYRGPTMLSTTLHAMAMLLRSCQWDWFINLSASDYPLVTQDDLIQAFSGVPRGINFIHHSSQLGWKLNKRGRPIIIDPGLYSLKKSQIWGVTRQRSLPTAFKLYTGSAWTVLSRSFSEYCIIGWENLPRTLLLYYTNFVSSPEGYFQTVICNSKDYKNTTANNDLHYITWDNPPKQHPRTLGIKDYRKMVLSNRPFARKFKKNDPVLDKIDRELLKRHRGQFSFGGWCLEGERGRACPTLKTENYGVLKPGPASKKLKTLLSYILSRKVFRKLQCR
ncbi:beta-glucuronosyltransferase GlcAT14A isoform X1 [Abrus precatorius]|uniref:Beta-glucuronosyltransferase GlcAT14A isoform X1 n=1 Tax=Abrus precatorius TaxID=3816 RepID=A0A8B8LPP1_ABRPR|nr:beta-glucuronosyltransferase GlcAT14A isoform X1 [Abrus precatorius]